MSDALPIDALATDLSAAWHAGPVVVTAPTGSGKSTQVPRWCAAWGRVLVVQPRRVAARALATRVAQLQHAQLGEGVGYAVRDERVARSDTTILFVTTGVALRMLRAGDLASFDTVILDELHERSLDLDLLLALLADHPHLVAMSATLDGEAVAAHLGATHLAGRGRTFPVEIEHLADQPPLPEADRLEARIADALDAAPPEGDVLVFLPGRGEIHRAAERLRPRPQLEVLELHGGLSLPDQARVFRPSDRRKVILATNVAETSLTVPGIRVVIDSGLVRRNRYHQGRGVLTLTAVATDSAEQRAGRAGRTAPGVALRLWSSPTGLRSRTPPQIHRESLVPLVLGAAACGAPGLELPWLDPPRDHAIEAARSILRGLGALGSDHRLTEVGEELFGLPLDPALGRLLVEGRGRGPGALADALDLVAALSISRPLFERARPTDEGDDLRGPRPWPGVHLEGLDPDGTSGCDATALVRAIREGEPRRHHLDPHALREARQVAGRLRSALGLTGAPGPFDRRRLAQLLLDAWPGVAHVQRHRRRRVGWSNGGTELQLVTGSAVDPETTEAILVLDVRAVARHRLEQQRLCTAAMPVPLAWLQHAGLGRDRLAGSTLRSGAAVAVIERIYAGRVLQRREEIPTGALAREAIRELFLQGRIFDLELARDRLEAQTLWARLHDTPLPPELPAWIDARLEALGLEDGADLALLDADDLLPDDLPAWDRERLDRDFPRSLDLGDAVYAIHYHPARRLLVLEKTSGPRKTLPPLRYVPKVPGWRIEVVDRNVRRILRE
ncbi:MAG TPA: ATP-dependent RNA helicase [Deltaproteobacteria bacterium]|nr:ATP-dependent RNA helicase [Deltaproteobacteria bacterium]